MKYAKVLALILTLFPILAAAQMRSSQKIAATVPFDFVVGHKVIPAGDCTVQRAEANGSTLLLRNLEAGTGAFAMPTAIGSKMAAGSYALVFHRYGDRHFLAAVTIADGTMYKLPEGRLESELRAQNLRPTEQILLAALK